MTREGSVPTVLRRRRTGTGTAPGAVWEARDHGVVRGFRYGRGFGHLFGLLFLFRHPLVLAVVVVAVVVVYVYRNRR